MGWEGRGEGGGGMGGTLCDNNFFFSAIIHMALQYQQLGVG